MDKICFMNTKKINIFNSANRDYQKKIIINKIKNKIKKNKSIANLEPN